MQKKANPAALLPILEFLLLYLGLGLIFEYVLKIPMGFYSIPIVVIFLVALLAACCQNRALSFDDKLTLMGQGIGDKNIVTMLLIFLAAGIFVGVVGRASAESVAYFMLSIIPFRFAVAVLFVVSCFVSTAMGTSVASAAGRAMWKFSRNLSFIAQPCPLQAAMVVSEMKLRLSPNIAPPMTEPMHSGRE